MDLLFDFFCNQSNNILLDENLRCSFHFLWFHWCYTAWTQRKYAWNDCWLFFNVTKGSCLHQKFNQAKLYKKIWTFCKSILLRCFHLCYKLMTLINDIFIMWHDLCPILALELRENLRVSNSEKVSDSCTWKKKVDIKGNPSRVSWIS